MTNARFEIKLREDGQYQFNLIAPNNEIILVSEAYTSLSGCKNGLESVKKNASDDFRYLRLDAETGDKIYFVLTAPNGQVIGVSQMYANEAVRENGIEAVKSFAPDAEIIELAE